MIFLQSAAAPIITWRTYIQDVNQIAQIVGTLLVLIYVIYTYKTFAQIKKQTDYQQDAYLKLESSILKENLFNEDGLIKIIDNRINIGKNQLSRKYLKTDISAKLTEILKPIFKFEDNLFEGNYFTVGLTNYGNAEVNMILLKLHLTIIISKDVAEKRMLKERENHEIEVKIEEIIGRNGGNVKIPIISTASFPAYIIEISGEYFDVRNKRYNINKLSIRGQNDHFNKLP